MNELRDAQLVTQRLMERQETALETLTSVVHSHEQRLANAEDGIAEMRSALTSVMNSIDRFIRGQERNGH